MPLPYSATYLWDSRITLASSIARESLKYKRSTFSAAIRPHLYCQIRHTVAAFESSLACRHGACGGSVSPSDQRLRKSGFASRADASDRLSDSKP
jgi:hypothetical protein